MSSSRDYADQDCSLARSLEIVGERWTLLVLRDAFYGVTRFGDFASHLDIPRAILSDRLGTLVDEGLMERAGEGPRAPYVLTAKGIELWPTVRGLMEWGERHYSESRRRDFRHSEDGGLIGTDGICAVCGAQVDVAGIDLVPGPGLVEHRDDPVSQALREPHRLLVPVR